MLRSLIFQLLVLLVGGFSVTMGTHTTDGNAASPLAQNQDVQPSDAAAPPRMYIPSVARPVGASPAPTRTPSPSAPAPLPTATPETPTASRMYGVLFGDQRYLESDWDAGIRLRELELSWWRHEPHNDAWDLSYVAWKRAEIQAAREAGYKIVLDLGLQYPPAWARQIQPMQDQYGNTYDRHVNAVWSAEVRDEIAAYIKRAFADFGTDFYGIRVGSGGWIETMYPPTPAGFRHSYWAFDPAAMASNPVPDWRPGQASPNDEARRFYTWYVESLAGVVNWQHRIIRRYYDGKLLQLFAGIGVRPEGWEGLIADNLIPGAKRLGVDAAARGVVIDRLVGSIQDKRDVVLVSCSLGDASATAWWLDEDSADRLKWSSSHWAADVAKRHGMPIWGENGGYDDDATMKLVFEQLEQFDYGALFWAFDKQLHEGTYASIDDYARLIAENP